ncbi:MAG: isochorismatase family protein [Betaproteobacteria bacterium]|nr:isochorismatase family protein [Betaproteobacteria bacterium]
MSSARAILISDCLQQDFVGPVGRFEALPNALHVGHDEALRLLGPNPAEGPVARVLAWAHAQPDERLKVIHVRDWHDANDSRQHSHLEQFGAHCIRGTSGASFVFRTDDIAGDKRVEIVDATTLSNFIGADLQQVIEPYAGEPARVGLMGVWTEAKITFLAYEIRIRYPHFRIAVCSALTASSSRQNHFVALDQLEKIVGVEVLASVGEFVDFLGAKIDDAPLIGFSQKHPQLIVADASPLREIDCDLVRYLFRGCREVSVRSLDGGFSGNAVLATRSVDVHGHEQVAHVVKIGAKGPIGQERAVFERIEAVLGNSAPRVADFADLGERGAIKYRYAAMGGGASQSFQKRYESGASDEEVRRVLDVVFIEQLGRLYRAAEPERCDLLEYYQFSPSWAPSVRSRVRAIEGDAGFGGVLEFPGGRRVAHIATFYEQTLAELPRIPRSRYFAHLHGDLNGANIIVDGQGNVWLIDFFHSHRGHVLRDLAKFENDVLYIFTKIEGEAEFAQALALTDLLLSVQDLAAALPAQNPLPRSPKLARAYRTVRHLRSYYPGLIKADRDTTQLLAAQVRYAVHTLGFEESSRWQKRWALYTACAAAAQLRRKSVAARELRIDWLPAELTVPGRVGLTLLPGRRDAGRSIEDDLEVIAGAGVTALVCLLAHDEFARYGVENLLQAYRSRGVDVLHTPIVDGFVPSVVEMKTTTRWIDARVRAGAAVLVHCVGGLGRAGTIAACWLRSRGQGADDAIATVRRARSMRAIETPVQEEMIRKFAAGS